jgi:hypothetical protein
LPLITTFAYADGVTPQQSFGSLKTWLMGWIPAAATVVLMVIGALYAKSMVRKDTFVDFAVGLIFIGSASEIVGMFLGGS